MLSCNSATPATSELAVSASRSVKVTVLFVFFVLSSVLTDSKVVVSPVLKQQNKLRHLVEVVSTTDFQILC